jgi:hypothetical protein
VAWYGGGRRDGAAVSGTGPWSRAGAGLGAVRWVDGQGRTGTHSDECFAGTDIAMTPQALIEE